MSRATVNEAFVRHLQGVLGVESDGYAGDITRRAFDAAHGAPGGQTAPVQTTPANGAITERLALELIGHEAIVREAYKDSKGIWTWGIGVTNASGHSVDRYKDNPQTIERCIEIYLWLVREKYLPDVVAAFGDFPLSEAQAAAALSFHYNTGAIKRASWVKSFLAGDVAKARRQFMEWRRPPEIIERREKERDLFFDGKWSGDGKATVYDVRKPSYAPNWSSARKVDVREALREALS